MTLVLGWMLMSSGVQSTRAVAAGADYGRNLPVIQTLGLGPTMAAALADDRLYTIGRGTLRVFAAIDPAHPRLLGQLGGLGNTRQLVVRDGWAFVTSREDGAFIVDVSDPTEPRLACHYDTVEVATGVAVAGDVLFITCRHYGVELIDISNPGRPRHLATARTGESQSVAVRDGYAYVGVWGSSELVVVDVRNPRQPQVTARCELDGFGDGVFVHGEYVFIATGHHSRQRTTWHPQPGDPGYGKGHGLEIFRLEDPAHPTFVSRLKTPPFYHLGHDMWSVRVSGDYAFLADTHNGVWSVEVSDASQPVFAGHVQLPVPAGESLPDYVGGLAVGRDVLYVAGGETDLYVVEARGLAQPVAVTPGTPPVIPPPPSARDERFVCYRPTGQVRAVVLLDDHAVVAAGSAGVHVVQLTSPPRLLHAYETKGFAMGVATSGKLVYVAEERGGLSIWRADPEGNLHQLGRYQPAGKIVREVVVPPPGRYALLQVGLSRLEILDLSDPSHPVCVLTDQGHGFLYDLTETLGEGRYACALWQLDGVARYDLAAEPTPCRAPWEYRHRLGNDGLVTAAEGLLVVFRGGYLLLGKDDTRPPTDLPLYRVPEVSLRGKPRLFGDELYVADRREGVVAVADLADPHAPTLLRRLKVAGNPGRVAMRNGKLVLPNGYEGLWVER